jgi:hypothetical protein
MKIIILIFYYGRFPWYFSYFLHSCKFNPDIDFLIFSDTEFDGELPRNVTIVIKPVKELQRISSEKMGFAVDLSHTRKLCDLKPAYGYLLSEHTSGYDFWGYSDIDVIFGNIRHFITDELLQSCDVISVLHDFLAGYFTLFRNCKEVNELFRQSKDYQKVFANPEHFCFDECNFAFWEMDKGKRLEDVECDIDSMTHVIRRLHEEKVINAHFDTYSLQGLGGKLKWENGVLVYKNKYEVMLYHLIKFKSVYERRPPKTIPSTFRISPSKIYW